MAKLRKRRPPPAIAELQSHREWLIRVVLIGQGYVKTALDKATDPTERALYARHNAEIDLAINVARPAAEDVLQLLGRRVAMLRATLEAYPGRAGVTEQQHNAWIYQKDAALKAVGA